MSELTIQRIRSRMESVAFFINGATLAVLLWYAIDGVKPLF